MQDELSHIQHTPPLEKGQQKIEQIIPDQLQDAQQIAKGQKIVTAQGAGIDLSAQGSETTRMGTAESLPHLSGERVLSPRVQQAIQQIQTEKSPLIEPPINGYPDMAQLQKGIRLAVHDFFTISGQTPHPQLRQSLDILLEQIARATPLSIPPRADGQQPAPVTPEAALYTMQHLLQTLNQQIQMLTEQYNNAGIKGAISLTNAQIPRIAKSLVLPWMGAATDGGADPSATQEPNASLQPLEATGMTPFQNFGTQTLSHQAIVCLDEHQLAQQIQYLLATLHQMGSLSLEQLMQVGMTPSATVPMPLGTSVNKATSTPPEKQIPHEGVYDPASNLSPDTQKKLRKKINKAIKDEDEDALIALAKNPQAMAVATPSQKSKMIKEFVDGPTSGEEDRAILDVLNSCTTREEFDSVVKNGGGKEIFEEIDVDDVKKKMSTLAGAWGRSDLATDKKAARQAEGELLKPHSELFKVGDPKGLDSDLDKEIPANASATERNKAITEQYIKKQAYTQISPQTHKELVLENADRRSKGKSLLTLAELTADMEKKRAKGKLNNDDGPFAALMGIDPDVEKVRKKHGLSEDSMNRLATTRMGQIYSEAGQVGTQVAKQQIKGLRQEYEQAVAKYGKNSDEARKINSEMSVLMITSQKDSMELENIGENLMALYPPPKDWWEYLGMIIEPLLDFGAMIANCIPVVGNAIGAAYFGVKAIISAATGNIGEMLGSVASALGPLGKAVGGSVGMALNTAGQVAKGVVATGQGVKSMINGDWANALGTIAGGLGTATAGTAELAGANASNIKDIEKFTRLAASGTQLAGGLASGDWMKALGGIGGVADSIHNAGGQQVFGDAGREALDLFHRSAKFGSELLDGNFGNVLQELAGGFPEISNFLQNTKLTNHPAITNLLQYAKDGIGFVDNLTNGRFNQAFGALNKAFEGMPNLAQLVQNPTIQNAIKDVHTGMNFFQNLTNGRGAEALKNAAQQMAPLFTGRDLAHTMSTTQGLAGVIESMARGDTSQMLRRLVTGSYPTQPLLQSLIDGTTRRHIESMVLQARDLSANPTFRQAMDELSPMSTFLQRLVNGQIDHNLQFLLQSPEMDLLRVPIAQVSQLVQQSSPFLRSLANGDCLSHLQMLAGPGSTLAHQPAFSNALPMLQNATSFMELLASPFFASQLGGFQTALHRVVNRFPLLHHAIHSIENHFREIVPQVNASPDQLLTRLMAQLRDPMAVAYQPSAIRS
jgi:hypothetical protein